MGTYGWKIRNYKAATVYGRNIGIRDRYDYTEAMLHHSLFSDWLRANGMDTGKNDDSTRDIICLDFQFGLRSYKEELQHLDQMRKDAENNPDKLKQIDLLESRVHSRKELYRKLSKDQIRRIFYENGVDITYNKQDKQTGELIPETIHYRMLYRNPSKAKQGSVMFIREELYDRAYDWLTMGIGKRLPQHNAKIVEISAYAPLSTSAVAIEKVGDDFVCGFTHIPVDDVLVLRDQDSFFHTIADIVRAEDYEVTLRSGKKETRKRCTVTREETDVKNTLWDGMALIESDVMPTWCNGMMLMRNHFFKACAFRTRIQQFFIDYCNSAGIDYNTYMITDMFGVPHLAKDIKLITTDNAIKWKKFVDLMWDDTRDDTRGDLLTAYNYWRKRIIADGCIWGIVKSDHPSKLGSVQQMSYQMINTLPCGESDIEKIAQTSVAYVERLKSDNDEFAKFLRKNATVVNHYEMLADLYRQNPDFSNSKMWKVDKSKIINQYVTKLRKGKITVEGDNLTVCGNPYALLMYTVGLDWNNDPTLLPDDGVIQVYTKRFADGEYLCGIRNPHNSSNNLGYFKNVHHPLMAQYFDFSPNIMAVNCIHTDVQSRMNGEDFDSDFNFVTNQPQMVEAARVAYRDYPTVVNEVPESGMSYNNTMKEYARMDSAMQSAQKAIGGSSDSAQLSQSYYWTKVARGEDDEEKQQLYENTVILAVCAQLAIDGCKKIFSVNVNNDILRIRQQPCMNRQKDYPKFMKWTAKIPVTKNGKERPYEDIKQDKKKVCNRIDDKLVCPMNWLQDCLDRIQGSEKDNVIDTHLFLSDRPPGKPKATQMGKIRKAVEEYDWFVKQFMQLYHDDEDMEIFPLIERTEEIIAKVSGMKISNITIYRLIETALGIEGRTHRDKIYRNATKYTRKMMNVLYQTNREKFLKCFKTVSHI